MKIIEQSLEQNMAPRVHNLKAPHKRMQRPTIRIEQGSKLPNRIRAKGTNVTDSLILAQK